MAAEVLDAINSILQYQQQRDKSDLAESLALMQFAQQRKATNVAMFEKQLLYAEKANTQMKTDVAQGWIQSSGLQAIADIVPTGLEDADDIQSELQSLSKKLRHKDYGKFSEKRANEIASALWAFKNANEPSGVINIASGLDRMMQLAAGGKATDEQNAFIKSIHAIAADVNIEEASRLASKSLENDLNIRKEQFEFAQGDTEIQSDFGLLSPEVVDDFKQQSQDINYDISSLADMIEGDLNVSTKENVFRGGYEPPTNNALMKAVSYLPEEAQSSEKERIASITEKQNSLNARLDELSEERDELIDDYDDMVEKRDTQSKIFKYHRKAGNKKGWMAALKVMNELDNEIKKNRGSNRGTPAYEKEAQRLGNSYGPNWTRQGGYEDSYTNKIYEIKESIQALERERTKFL